MLSVVDIIVYCILLYFAVNGWSKGFLRTILGPLSLILCVVIGTVYFRQTHDVWKYILIMLFGPVVLSISLSLILMIWNRTVSQTKYIFWLSRLLGSIFNVTWGGIIIATTLIFISIIPMHTAWAEKTKDRLVNSHSYAFLNKFIKGRVPYVNNLENLFDATQDPEKMEELKSAPEFKDIYSDQKIQNVVADEDLMKELKEKDIVKLMTDPKIQSIIQDEGLLKKILNLYSNIQPGSQDPDPEPKSEPPKVYKIENGKIIETIE